MYPLESWTSVWGPHSRSLGMDLSGKRDRGRDYCAILFPRIDKKLTLPVITVKITRKPRTALVDYDFSVYRSWSNRSLRVLAINGDTAAFGVGVIRVSLNGDIPVEVDVLISFRV